MYYGYAFESYCTTDSPTSTAEDPKRDGDNPLWGGDVNTNVQWCSVVKTKLGDMRIIIGGEVDCVRGRCPFCLPFCSSPLDSEPRLPWLILTPAFTGTFDPRKTDNYVELKTSMTIRKWNQGDEVRFEK